jgi:hypothetical protein
MMHHASTEKSERLQPGNLQRLLAVLCIALIGVLLSACDTPEPQAVQPLPTVPADRLGNLHIAMGQLVFVPAYSEIFYGYADQTLELTTTLAIHNTDLSIPIIVNSVRYFDTDGNLVREFIEQPVQLHPMATTGFVIESSDTSGGWGANFLVEWVAEEPVHEPVIEAVMVSREGVEGVSFISTGRVVSEQRPPDGN